VVLLILDLYPLQRFRRSVRPIFSVKQIWFEKIPFVLMALGAMIAAFHAKKVSMKMLAQHGVADRVMQAAYGLCFYLWKTVIPTRLSSFYLLDKSFDPLTPKYILCAVFVFSVTAGLIGMRRRWPWALAAWACYVVIVSPLLGFIQSGPQVVAERYTYIACMPFGVLAGAGMFSLWEGRLKEIWPSTVFVTALAVVLAGLVCLSTLSFRQSRIWYNDYTFMNHVIALDPANAAAYYYRGVSRERVGDTQGALADYNRAIRLDPDHAKAYNNRGAIRKDRGDLAGALKDFNHAIRLEPHTPEAYANRGMVRQAQRDFDGAVQDFKRALEVASGNWAYRATVENSLARILAGIPNNDNSSEMNLKPSDQTGSRLRTDFEQRTGIKKDTQ
jgi:cytochrome c-type biogenesis protein CcmH/NrfG